MLTSLWLEHSLWGAQNTQMIHFPPFSSLLPSAMYLLWFLCSKLQSRLEFLWFSPCLNHSDSFHELALTMCRGFCQMSVAKWPWWTFVGDAGMQMWLGLPPHQGLLSGFSWSEPQADAAFSLTASNPSPSLRETLVDQGHRSTWNQIPKWTSKYVSVILLI